MAKSISQKKVFDVVGYVPHDDQKKFHAALNSHRFRIWDAGRRTGKSTGGGHELVPYAYEAFFKRDQLDKHENRMEYWIVGPEYSDSEKEFRVLYNDLKKLEMPFDKPGTYYDANAGNLHISLWDGRFQVHGKSAKYPQNLVGEKLRGVILAEAAKLKASIWTKYLRPMLADYRGWATMVSTPEGKNWFYQEFMKGLSEDPAFAEYWSQKTPSWNNNLLFPLGRNDPEIISMENGLTGEAFKQEVGAEFTEFVGRVFKEFDEEMHCRTLEFNPEFATFAAVDYGWTNPFVWLLVQVDYWNNVYVIGELYGSHKRVDEVHHEIKAKNLCPPQLRYFYPDPASPSDTRILEDNLNITAQPHTGGELKERLRMIRKWLEIPPHLCHLADDHPDKQPKLFVDADKCPNFVREFNDYRYPQKKNESEANDSETPMKKDDHTPEAIGRLFAGLFGNQEPHSSAVVVDSVMG
jgi:hypothetical protein